MPRNNRISITDLKRLIEGSPCAHLNRGLLEELEGPKPKSKGQRIPPKPSKEKQWISEQLGWWCRERRLELKAEYRFASPRRWSFDWAIPAMMVAIEYEGLFAAKSRHTTAKGYTGDTEKYNQAQALGWRVVRVTALNYHTVVQEVNKFYKLK